MPLSARKPVHREGRSVKVGSVMCEVVIDIGGGHRIVSLISASSAKRLKLKKGAQGRGGDQGDGSDRLDRPARRQRRRGVTRMAARAKSSGTSSGPAPKAKRATARRARAGVGRVGRPAGDDGGGGGPLDADRRVRVAVGGGAATAIQLSPRVDAARRDEPPVALPAGPHRDRRSPGRRRDAHRSWAAMSSAPTATSSFSSNIFSTPPATLSSRCRDARERHARNKAADPPDRRPGGTCNESLAGPRRGLAIRRPLRR